LQIGIGGEERFCVLRREAVEPKLVPRVVLVNDRKDRIRGRSAHFRRDKDAVVLDVDRILLRFSSGTEMEGLDGHPMPGSAYSTGEKNYRSWDAAFAHYHEIVGDQIAEVIEPDICPIP